MADVDGPSRSSGRASPERAVATMIILESTSTLLVDVSSSTFRAQIAFLSTIQRS